jgi:hypothetical protein
MIFCELFDHKFKVSVIYHAFGVIGIKGLA